jgi:hypothetical protein
VTDLEEKVLMEECGRAGVKCENNIEMDLLQLPT